jgi:rhodanese-related sulfurtransferase
MNKPDKNYLVVHEDKTVAPLSTRQKEALLMLIVINYAEEHGLLNAEQLQDARASLRTLFLHATGEETMLRKLIGILKINRALNKTFGEMAGILAGLKKSHQSLTNIHGALEKQLAQRFGVQSVPAFVVMDQGRPMGGKVGAMNRKQLRELVEPFLPRAAGAVKAAELAQLLKQHQVTPIDIRDAAVFNRARLPGAQSFPEEELATRLAELHMLPGPAELYCRSGDKAGAMAQKLAQEGLPVAFLEGGVLEWEAAGFDMER